MWRRVRCDSGAADPNIGAAVRTGGVNGSAGKDDSRKRGIRATINDELDIHGKEPALTRNRGTMPNARRMALRRRGHVFFAIVDNLHRPSGLPGKQRRVPCDHRRVLFFAAKRTACFLLDDANLVSGKAEQVDQRFVNVIRALE